MRQVVVALLCAAPLALGLSALREPFGQGEDALNAAIWSFGAANLVRHGPLEARLGAKVEPFPGDGHGVYAHHPPLPVWGAAVPVALGGREAAFRLLGLLCAAAGLLQLHRLLGRVFHPDAALVGLAAAALSPYALVYGRMFTTLTLAFPLVTTALLEWERAARREPPRWRALAWLGLLVASSWDGVLAALALAAALALEARRTTGRWTARALAPVGVVVSAVALLLAYLAWANQGAAVLSHQFQYRATDPQRGLLDFAASQWALLGSGLTPPLLLLCLAAPALLRLGPPRAARLWGLASVSPWVMVLLFRHGAARHGYWGYLLIVPAAAAAALLAQRLLVGAPWRRVALGLSLAGYAALALSTANAAFERDARLNALGPDVARWFSGTVRARVPVFAHQGYHPYVTWQLGLAPDAALSVDEVVARVTQGRWQQDEPLLADADFAQKQGCGSWPRGPVHRWVRTTPAELLLRCGRAPP